MLQPLQLRRTSPQHSVFPYQPVCLPSRRITNLLLKNGEIAFPEPNSGLWIRKREDGTLLRREKDGNL